MAKVTACGPNLTPSKLGRPEFCFLISMFIPNRHFIVLFLRLRALQLQLKSS